MGTQATQENLEQVLKDPLAFDFDKAFAVEDDAAEAKPNEDEKPSGEASDAAGEKAEPEQKDDAKKDDEPAPATADEQEGAVIKTKDGKHEIPYSVLAAQREANRRLQDQIAELNAKLAAQEAEAGGGPKDLSKSVGDIISADELAALKEDAPKLGELVEKLVSKIGDLEQSASVVQQERAKSVAETVQEAIDGIPKLAHLQANDPERWDQIVSIDQWARQQPQFKGLDLADRFAKVLGMYEAAHGAIELSESSASGKQKDATDDVAAKAKAKVDAALTKAAPNTLSDIPGGNPPARDAVEEVTGMSAVALTQKMMSMNDKQMEQFLSQFA